MSNMTIDGAIAKRINELARGNEIDQFLADVANNDTFNEVVLDVGNAANRMSRSGELRLTDLIPIIDETILRHFVLFFEETGRHNDLDDYNYRLYQQIIGEYNRLSRPSAGSRYTPSNNITGVKPTGLFGNGGSNSNQSRYVNDSNKVEPVKGLGSNIAKRFAKRAAELKGKEVVGDDNINVDNKREDGQSRYKNGTPMAAKKVCRQTEPVENVTELAKEIVESLTTVPYLEPMSDEDVMNYNEHELNDIEKERLAKYDLPKVGVAEKRKEIRESDDGLVAFKLENDEVHVVSNTAFISSHRVLQGLSEYYDGIHSEGKTVITLFGEYGDYHSIYVPSLPTRNKLLDFSDRILTETNFNELISEVKLSGRISQCIINIIERATTTWAQTLVDVPSDMKGVSLRVTGDIVNDINRYVNDIGLIDTGTAEFLIKRMDTLNKFVPKIKTVKKTAECDDMGMISSFLPTDVTDKCLMLIDYVATVAIPFDYKTFGLDMKDNHAFIKVSEHPRFFGLYKQILTVCREIDVNSANITVILTDRGGHKLLCKQLDANIIAARKL